MSSPGKIRAIVLTCDNYRSLTDHMIVQYERLWPDHPFLFRIPFQKLDGPPSARREYVPAPGGTASDIAPSILALLAKIDDEEMVYWCADDKYPVQLVTEKIRKLVSYAATTRELDGLMFCRCRVTLDRPELALLPQQLRAPSGEVLLERRGWFQFWIHQLIRAKVLRDFFSQMPARVESAKAMDTLKMAIPKKPEHRLFVTRENFAVFGESTQNGQMTRNCYESIQASGLAIPKRYRSPSRKRILMGKL